MKLASIWLLMVNLLAFSWGALWAAEPSRCERIFKEQSTIATCNTMLNMYGSGLSDEELRERVSQAVYGVSADQAEKMEQEKERREIERKAKDAEAKAIANKTDQCYRLFTDPLERETCRTLRVLTYRQRTDDEMRKDVKIQIESTATDLAIQRKAAIEAEEKRRNYDAWLRRTTMEEEERRKAEAAREKRAAIERERKRKEAARVLDSRLGRGTIGFSFTSWEKSGFGTVLIVHFILQNNTKTAQKDFEIECDTRGNSETLLGRTRKTLYERIEPGVRQAYSLNMGVMHSQTARTSCAVVKWMPA